MASTVAKPAEPTMHVDPYEGAKELRVILRQLVELVGSGADNNTRELAKHATNYVDAASERLGRVRDQLDRIEAELPLLEEAIRARRAGEGTARVENLRSRLNSVSGFATTANLHLSSSATSNPSASYWLRRITKPPPGSASATAVSLLKRARVIGQALPTTPLNATAPAEVVVNALVAILHNFKLVEPNPDAKKVAPAIAADAIEKNLAFEDQHGMSKDEYINEYGELPAGWEE